MKSCKLPYSEKCYGKNRAKGGDTPWTFPHFPRVMSLGVAYADRLVSQSQPQSKENGGLKDTKPTKIWQRYT